VGFQLWVLTGDDPHGAACGIVVSQLLSNHFHGNHFMRKPSISQVLQITNHPELLQEEFELEELPQVKSVVVDGSGHSGGYPF
jgi:hypothetical protein